MISVNKKVLPVLISAALLGACKDSSDNSSSNSSGGHQTSGFDVNEAGRVVITSASEEAPEVGIFDSQDGDLISRLDLNYPVTGLSSSPQSRYALIAQKSDNQVQILDGGLYQEDHGDHLHPYEQDPEILSQIFSGTNPHHVRNNEDHAAFYFDGDSSKGLLSSIIAFDDDKIANNSARTLELDYAIHGAAEPVEDYILTTYRVDAETGSANLPNKVKVYQYNSTSGLYDDFKTFDELCPSLHGSFSTEDASVFGCLDGLLVIHNDDDIFTAEKVAYNSRFTGFSGHPDSHVIAGWSNKELYAIDLGDDHDATDSEEHDAEEHAITITPVNWRGDDAIDENAVYKTAHMDDEGNVLMVLDTTGKLHILHAENDSFVHEDTIQVLDWSEGDSDVSIASSGASEYVYITDKANGKLVVINIEHTDEGKLSFDLPFTPSYVTWVGIPGEAEEHDHDDDDHEGHDH